MLFWFRGLDNFTIFPTGCSGCGFRASSCVISCLKAKGTPFGVLLVIVATVYNWLCWFSLTGGDFLLYVLFLACCLLLLRLLQLVVLVFVGCRGFLDVCILSGILFVVVATITMGRVGFWEICSILCLFFALESFHWGSACGFFIVTF